MMDKAAVDRAFVSLDDWITTNGWEGYDPYDVRGQDWYVRLFGAQNWFFGKLRGALALVESRLPPLALRRLLRVRKQINAKGMGLIATAYLTRWAATGDETYQRKAEDVLSWLAENRSRNYPGASWGYPFHWQSRIFLPRGTPSVVVTATVGEAWLLHYELTESAKSLEIAEQIAGFLLQGLNRPVNDDEFLCFSYTPLDQFRVHNASLFAAAFLSRLGALTDNREYQALALRAVRYTLSEQNADGSFYYWGSEPPTIIDHYHTGFVLRHLDTVYRATSAQFIAQPLARGFEFYTERLFKQDGIPKFTPQNTYPIDVHSCAEAILCLSQLGQRLDNARYIDSVFALTQDKLLSADGWYKAAIRLKGDREVAQDIPYMRWGQSWMLLALARLQDYLAAPGADRQEHKCASV